MSEIKVNSIKGVGASTAAITVNNTDGTATANLTNRQGKNLVVNGGFQIAQRGLTSTSSGIKTVDRFRTDYTGVDEAPTQAQVELSASDTPYNSGFRFAYKITNGDQSNGAGSGDFIRTLYLIEAQDLANSGWNYKSSSSYITLSFWVKASVAQTYYVNFRAYDGSGKMYCFAVALSADTWTKVTHSIPGHADLSFDNDVNDGMYIQWFQYRGTNNTGTVTLNQWNNYDASILTPDQTSTWYTTNDATYELTGVQLEVGSVATDFEHRSFGQELALCQRYFQKIACTQMYMSLIRTADNQHRLIFNHPVTMRAAPTATVTSSNGDGAGTIGVESVSTTTIQMNQGSANSANAPNVSEYTVEAEL